MLRFILRRVATAIPTMLVIITLAFFLIRMAPGGPFDSERPVPPEIAANLDRAYQLDEPLPVQYGQYLWKVLQGDLGPSFKYQDHTVTELIAAGFPVSLQLGGSAILLAFVIGSVLGAVAAFHQNRALDFGIMAFAMTGITIPNFVMAPILALVFGVMLNWLPVGGWGDGHWSYQVLPVIALSLPQIAYIARMTRASMIETLHSHYIRTARAKGMPTRLIFWRHSLRGALTPVISYLGPATAAIITGSVVIEQLFAIPGIGRHFVQGALNRDYTLVMGVVIFYGGIIIFLNLLVDLLYGWLDPRVRHA